MNSKGYFSHFVHTRSPSYRYPVRSSALSELAGLLSLNSSRPTSHTCRIIQYRFGDLLRPKTKMVSLAQPGQWPVQKWSSCGFPYKSRRRSFYVVGSNRDDDFHATLRALKARGRTPRRSLGQHYMLNSTINEQLVNLAEVKDGDVVLEIGPGTGSLTKILVNAGAKVVAIEKDPHMAMHVRERFGDMGHVMVLQEDFTRCHIRSHIESFLEKPSKEGSRYAKVVSNIPFNISTEVIKQLLPMGDIISEVVLLLQDETALRLVDASLRTSEYRPVNIFVNFYSEPEYQFKVLRTNFFPQPNVDGAVAKFKLKHPSDYPEVTSTKSFFSMVNSAFNGKRKMLRRSLQHLSTSAEIENALENLGRPATSRPEELTLDDFVGLHNFLFKGEN